MGNGIRTSEITELSVAQSAITGQTLDSPTVDADTLFLYLTLSAIRPAASEARSYRERRAKSKNEEESSRNEGVACECVIAWQKYKILFSSFSSGGIERGLCTVIFGRAHGQTQYRACNYEPMSA